MASLAPSTLSSAAPTSNQDDLKLRAQIHFEPGTAVLTFQSKLALDKVVTSLKSDPSLRIRVEGHTDGVGDDAVNQRLSQERAEAVRAFLLSKGVQDSRVEAVGYGATMPIDSNSTEAGRARNRRIEFRVLTP